MPIYDYKCKQCGYLFEVEQKMNDAQLEFCPKCKGRVQRLISPVGVIFKGSGFHITDYSKDQSLPAPIKKDNKEKKPTKSKSEKIT